MLHASADVYLLPDKVLEAVLSLYLGTLQYPIRVLHVNHTSFPGSGDTVLSMARTLGLFRGAHVIDKRADGEDCCEGWRRRRAMDTRLSWRTASATRPSVLYT